MKSILLSVPWKYGTPILLFALLTACGNSGSDWWTGAKPEKPAEKFAYKACECLYNAMLESDMESKFIIQYSQSLRDMDLDKAHLDVESPEVVERFPELAGVAEKLERVEDLTYPCMAELKKEFADDLRKVNQEGKREALTDLLERDCLPSVFMR